MTDTLAEVEGYIQELRDLRAEVLTWCDGLSADALNWRPVAKPVTDTNSIYVMVAHLVGSEAWWIHQIIGGTDVQRDRPAEFAASGDDLTALRERMTAVAQRSEAVLRGLSAADLSAMRDTTLGKHNVRWCILHVVEHTARHSGHVELTRQLWESMRVERGA